MPLLICGAASGPGPLEVGDQVGLRTTMRDAQQVLTDCTMSWHLVLPDGTPLTGDPDHEAIGVYLSIFPTLSQSGIHRWKIQSHGPIFQIEQGKFRVRPSLI